MINLKELPQCIEMPADPMGYLHEHGMALTDEYGVVKLTLAQKPAKEKSPPFLAGIISHLNGAPNGIRTRPTALKGL